MFSISLISYRFQDLFPDAEMVRELQTELDKIILTGVRNIVQLVKNQEQNNLVLQDVEDEFEMKTHIQRSGGLTEHRPLDAQMNSMRRSDKKNQSEATVSCAC